jgi:tetratricopeptide (TPR) repeat protein
VKDKNLTFGKGKESFQIGTTREDWEGFKQLMEQSTMADRDLILRVLTMYSDPDQRRKEIKNLSKTYVELAEKVLPRLRRAEITMAVDKNSRSDQELMQMGLSQSDQLTATELLHAGAVTTDVNNKVQVYRNAEKKFPDDWRISNNLGCALLMQNKTNEAADAFKRAAKAAPNEAAVMNNLGIVEARNGNRTAAMDYYKKAGNSNETRYNMGIINIRNGQYADALANFGDNKGFNKALAQLLGGSAGAVKETIDASPEKDMAHSFYLKAVAAARQGNSADAISNLKSAIEKDNSWKAYAKDDVEFVKMRSDSNFTGLIN